MAPLVDIRTATHVAFDAPTAEQLLRIGATRVVLASDRLLTGPSRPSPLEHVRQRQIWWSSDELWDSLYSSETRWELPVVTWVSSSLHERVNLWRACSWLRDLGLACDDILILELEPVVRSRARSHEGSKRPFDCSHSVSDHPDEALLARIEKARPWPPERYARAVRLWNSYVDEDPLPFVESCSAGDKSFPELAPLWAFLSSFFPRRTTEAALRLSRFDEITLSRLLPEWQTPAGVAAQKSETLVDMWHLLFCTGDLFLPRRLEHWADHDSSAAVERGPGPKPPGAGYPMLSSVYRLTERGTRLRDEGLDQLTDAPSLPIAGTEAYSASAPWVLLEDGRLARL
ncbi:hypothetical protein [Sorangium sp. So ce1000]|uniref:hypothetical protein n=1 Tax=Sorangium sp. So ce1000 TaxID=3133325 RepID=UPI003F5FD3FA